MIFSTIFFSIVYIFCRNLIRELIFRWWSDYSNNKSIYEEMIVISISAVPPFHCSMCDLLVIDLWAAYVCCVCLHESNNNTKKASVENVKHYLLISSLEFRTLHSMYKVNSTQGNSCFTNRFMTDLSAKLLIFRRMKK